LIYAIVILKIASLDEIYKLHKNTVTFCKTLIIDEDGLIEDYDIRQMPCIPNGHIKWFYSLMANTEKEKCHLELILVVF
jgi:hypothetical protein